jgi:hypothetical protein
MKITFCGGTIRRFVFLLHLTGGILAAIQLRIFCLLIVSKQKTKTNFMVWVRERTIPTERPPLVGEVIANFCG